jgi:hypothetical protein
MAIMAVLTLIGTVSVMNLQQVIAAPHGPEDYPIFRQGLGKFVNDVSKQVLGQPQDPDKQAKLGLFRQLTGQFQNDVSVALRIGDPNEAIDLVSTYTRQVLEIFLGGPDAIPELVADYKLDVESLLGPC